MRSSSPNLLTGRQRLTGALLLFWLCAWAYAGPAVHEGVASCAASTCHGATQAQGDTRIRHDEYFLWLRRDAHSQAFNTLRSERSQTIARKLGWGDATAAPGCLNCHTGAPPPEQRGARFQLSDGVGCEACHGGSGPWLEGHTQAYRDAAARQAAGLFPTWDPAPRAALCLSCHQGDAEHRITHGLMAAGHPPLLFEHNTFLQLQPAHFDADADYRRRKGAPDTALDWQIGQWEAADRWLGQLSEVGSGLFPELLLFDCSACHRPMPAGRAEQARVGGQALGTVPLGDAAVLMVGHWLDAQHSAHAPRWQQLWRGLHQAVASGSSADLREQSRAMRDFLRSTLRPLALMPPDSAALRRQLKGLCSEGLSHLDADFAHAEQTSMALSVLLTALRERGALELTPPRRAALDAVYASVRDRETFVPATYRSALNQLGAALR